MFEIINLKIILKKYEDIFSDILFGFEFVNIEDNKFIFKDYFGNKMTGILNDNVINFYYQNNNYEKQINFELPSADYNNDIKVNEIIKEIRPNGTIIEKIERIYGFSKFSHDKRTLIDLISKRYVFNENIKIINLGINAECVNDLSEMKTVFESHMNVLVRPLDSVRWYKDSKYSTITLLNGDDISNIYEVGGIDKISRIYDLYNGFINERNTSNIFSIHLGLLNKDSLGYKELVGITDKEDSICGKQIEKLYIYQNPDYIYDLIRNRIGYKKEFNLNDRNSLIEAITYKKIITEEKKQRLEEKLDSRPIAFVKRIKRKLKNR